MCGVVIVAGREVSTAAVELASSIKLWRRKIEEEKEGRTGISRETRGHRGGASLAHLTPDRRKSTQVGL